MMMTSVAGPSAARAVKPSNSSLDSSLPSLSNTSGKKSNPSIVCMEHLSGSKQMTAASSGADYSAAYDSPALARTSRLIARSRMRAQEWKGQHHGEESRTTEATEVIGS